MKIRLFQIVFCAALCLFACASTFAAKKHYAPLQYQVIGVTNPIAQKNISTALNNFENQLAFPLTAEEVNHFYRKAPGIIQKSLAPFGYFRSTISKTVSKTAKNWQMTFTVKPGPLLKIIAMQVRVIGAGKHDRKFIQLLQNLPLHVDATLETEKYNNIKLELFNLATKRGYFQAKLIKSAIDINLSTYQAHITIIFDTGPRYRFGKTIFSKSVFREKFLRRFLTYQTGQYYNATKLETTQEGFVAGNLFKQVIIKPKIQEAKNNIVPIHIDLIPLKAKKYTVGLGYGTDTGVRGTLGVTLRRSNSSGQRFHGLLRASQHNSSVIAQYLIPGFDPAHDLFTVGAGASNIRQATGSARNKKAGLSYTASHGHWKNAVTLSYLTEQYNIIGLPRTSTELVYPTLSVKYIDIGHPKTSHAGLSFEIHFSTASADVFSQTSFSQIRANLNTLYTFQKTHTRFLFRTEAGHTNITDLMRLPLSLQLFAGGSRSVRGYEYNSLGPGRNLAVASTEIQQRMIADFYLTGFVDAGTVGDNNIFHHINVGTGPGIAWIGSIGTIELTVAKAITTVRKPWIIQFSMGTAL